MNLKTFIYCRKIFGYDKKATAICEAFKTKIVNWKSKF